MHVARTIRSTLITVGCAAILAGPALRQFSKRPVALAHVCIVFAVGWPARPRGRCAVSGRIDGRGACGCD